VLVFTAEGYIELPSLKSENVAVRSRRRQHSNQYREETVANYNGNKYKKNHVITTWCYNYIRGDHNAERIRNFAKPLVSRLLSHKSWYSMLSKVCE